MKELIIINLVLIVLSGAVTFEGINEEDVWIEKQLDIIDSVNKNQLTWKAELQFQEGSVSSINFLTGSVLEPKADFPLKTEWGKEGANLQLPTYFDARDKWANCPSVGTVRDQGACRGGWAVSTASVISDRICILSETTLQTEVSATNLLSCCRFCGLDCKGGMPGSAWLYWKMYGIVTGGDFGTKEGCQPYPIAPCEHFVEGERDSCKNIKVRVHCRESCISGYTKNYTDDLVFGDSIYYIKGEERHIQSEIMLHGPVQTSFAVYEDFLHYKSGVYAYHTGRFLGYQSVKVIGWGDDEQSGMPYWLAMNSWNSDWGVNGLFKILRGKNHCRFENFMLAGIPKL